MPCSVSDVLEPYTPSALSMDLQVNRVNIVLGFDPYVNESYCRCLHLFLRRPEKRNKEDAFKFPRQSKVGNIPAIKKGEEHIEGTLSCLGIYPALINLLEKI